MTTIDWSKIKVVIFDVDGTLYLQSKLRKKMMKALLTHYLVRPWRAHELKILMHFRRERERNHDFDDEDLETAQYIWCAQKAKYPFPKIREVVDRWIFQWPNQYLSSCVYPGVAELFSLLKKQNIKIAIYSDYKSADKLKAMNLEADLIVASTDPHVDRLKPNPKALFYIADQLKVAPEECLFIGDRQELDGECAERAGMPYLIVDKKPLAEFDFYTLLNKSLDNSLNHSIPQPL